MVYVALVLAVVAAALAVYTLRYTRNRTSGLDTLRALDGRLAEVEATLTDWVERSIKAAQRERMAAAREKLTGMRAQRDAAVEEALAVVQAAQSAAQAAPQQPETREQVLARLRREHAARMRH